MSTSAITRYDSMRAAIQAAHRIDDVKDIADKAKALQMYARQHQDAEMECWVADIRVRAKRRLGELSALLEVAENQYARPSAGTGKRQALAAAGLTKSEAHRCEQIASFPEAEFERYTAECAAHGRAVSSDDVVRMVVKAKKKGAVVEAIAAAGGCTVADLDELATSGRKFGTVYADPPWLYGNQTTRASTDNHYSGMSVDDICKLPVPLLAADISHLHLWTTNGFLFEAKRVIEAWGFEYKSCFVWVKPQMGIGNYWRVSHEFLLLATRGTQVFADKSLKSWGEFSRCGHSQKPEEVRGMIQRASPGPRLELFGRRAVDDWTVWGNQIERNLFHQVAA